MRPVALSLAAAGAYAAVFAAYQPLPRYDCIVLPALLWFVFRTLDPLPHAKRLFALSCATFALLLGLALHLWIVGYEGRNAVFGGVIPWSDSRDFFGDALRLEHGGRLTPVSSRRPLFPLALAAALHLFGDDLKIALLLFALLGALAISLAAVEVWRTHGYLAALVVYALLFACERRRTGFVQSEHLGIPLGALGFALAWRAQSLPPSRGAERALYGALFALGVALIARSGAFFVLPALIAWGAWRSPERRVRIVVVGALLVASVFLVNKVVHDAIGTGVTFNEYPAILFGMMHDQDFTYLIERHPEIASLDGAARATASWHIVFGEISREPLLLLHGFARSFVELFTSPHGMFSYLYTNPDDHVLEPPEALRALVRERGILGPIEHWYETLGALSIVNTVAMVILSAAFVVSFIVAMARVVRRRNREPMQLLFAANCGVLASAPFLPPWITSGMQVETATMAFVAALPAVVLFGRPRDEHVSESRALLWVAPGAVVALFLSLAWIREHPEPIARCAAGEPHAYEILPHTAFDVQPTRTRSFRHKAQGDLETSLSFLARHNQALAASLRPYVKSGAVFTAAYDICAGRQDLLVDDQHTLDIDARDPVRIRTTPLADKGVLHVDYWHD